MTSIVKPIYFGFDCILSLLFTGQGFFIAPESSGGGDFMGTRIAVISIIIESKDSVDKVNSTLHDYGDYIIGRLGLPYRKRGISIICVVLDAPNDVISALSGKLGMIPDVTSKSVYSKVFKTDESEGE
jgi:putative iron-only hydrogenase system regulator